MPVLGAGGAVVAVLRAEKNVKNQGSNHAAEGVYFTEDEISALGADIDRSRSYLDRTSQYSVDAFNQKVNRVNEMSNRLQDATAAYNRRVDAFNAELARVGTPIY